MTSRWAVLPPGSRPCRTLRGTRCGSKRPTPGSRRQGHERRDAVAEVVDLDGAAATRSWPGATFAPGGGEVLLERGFAQAWDAHLGDTFHVGRLGPQRVVGFVEAPDNVGFPLAKPRFYISRQEIEQRFDTDHDPDTDLAEIWLRNPRYLNEVLVQARATQLRPARHPLRHALGAAGSARPGGRDRDRPAGGTFGDRARHRGAMLAASARAEVQRRLGTIGVRRAVGASRGHIALSHAVEALLVAAPAATIGLTVGALATYGPASRLLTLLNEPPREPGSCSRSRARGCSASRSPSAPRRGPRGGPPGARSSTSCAAATCQRAVRAAAGCRFAAAGWRLLGARLVAARRVRLVATVVTLGLSTAFVLLMLALATALGTLETDPGALGKRYQLTASLPPDAGAAGALDTRRAGERAALPGARRRLVLARRDDQRDRLPGRPHRVRSAAAVVRPPAARIARGRGRGGPGGRARSRPWLDACARASLGHRAPPAGVGSRQLARPRRAGGVRARIGAACRGSERSVADRGEARPRGEPSPRHRCLDGPWRTSIAGERPRLAVAHRSSRCCGPSSARWRSSTAWCACTR